MSPAQVVVCHPNSRIPERRYILDTILGCFLGLEYESVAEARDDTSISVVGCESDDQLVVRDVLLQTTDDRWLSTGSLPSLPLRTWHVSDCLCEARVVSRRIPVIYGQVLADGTFLQRNDQGIMLGLDVFGSAFFMLTRYEEVAKAVRDSHDRFPASQSLAYEEGFLDRPIIDEYVEILWSCMKRLWPGLRRRKWQYRLLPSHDVDHPLAVLNRPWADVLRSSAADVLRRGDIRLSWNRIRARADSASNNHDQDPYNTFDFIMDVSEKSGLRSTFYFITDHTGAGHIDGYYSVEMQWIRELMRRMHSRGHEIGLHGSYNSCSDANQARREFGRLLDAAREENIDQVEWGSRQHYLRWVTPITWRILAETGIGYDSTLAYADHVGFRCGVCHPFIAYDLVDRRVL